MKEGHHCSKTLHAWHVIGVTAIQGSVLNVQSQSCAVHTYLIDKLTPLV